MLRRVPLFLALAGGIAIAQTRPAFEVASVKPCHEGDIYAGGNNSLGRLTLGCLPVETLISMAYIEFANGHRDPFSTTVLEGGPDWIQRSAPASDRYAIDAEANAGASPEIMQGPMMQSLLEERFHLRVHRETRQVHLYALVVDKGVARLKPFDGTCTPRDYTKAQQPRPAEGKPLCTGSTFGRGDQFRLDLHGTSMSAFADRLGTVAERSGLTEGPVVDRTELSGLFDIQLEFSGGTGAGDAGIAGGESLFAALQNQLGLKLERTTGPREFIVIDHIEKASGN